MIMFSKIIRHSKWILALLCFYPIISFSNESFADVCKYQEELKINDKKKCLYKCQKSIRFFMVKPNEQCYSEIKLFNKRVNSKKFNTPKLNFGFSTLDGSSIGIELKLK